MGDVNRQNEREKTMAKTQMAKIQLNGSTYTIVAESDSNVSEVKAFRVYKAWYEYRPDSYPLKHKKQIGKEQTFFKALTDVLGDMCGFKVLLVTEEYMSKLQSRH